VAGSLLVRSYQQAEGVYQAMLLRGYGNLCNQENRIKSSTSTNCLQFGSDLIYLFLSLIISVSLVLAELFF